MRLDGADGEDADRAVAVERVDLAPRQLGEAERGDHAATITARIRHDGLGVASARG